MDDKDLTPADIQELSSRDGVASFFARLGYRTDSRLAQTPAAMGITAEGLQRQIRQIERIALQGDGAEPLDVYLIELTSVTVANTQGLARALRNRAGNYLLILTDDYERLDFVLLERSLPSSPTSGLATRQVSVRPRIITIDRRNPNVVQLRVLRRFTYTEADSDAQYEKLLSAYGVADWSEPLFNNRALFSDYYLNERLREREEWRERPEIAYHALRELYTSARQRLSGQSAAATRANLVEPALSALGFSATPQSSSGSTLAHYRLQASGAAETVALCLAYTWNRNLDGRDETRDSDSADENPGASVVTLLDSGEAPWAIVTNGKVWRLYSARAHSRATNYYEIDLDETLAMSDPNLAFRYFWLIFRAAAFVTRDVTLDGETRRLSFLEELVEESESYAKGLGERLKEQVFEEIFPHFAEGFIGYLRGQLPITGSQQTALLPVAHQLALKQEPDEAFRRQVFLGTLTFLYRLLFLLYAESRGLLPVKEVRGYWELSLTNLKKQVSDKAGDISDEAPEKLRRAYSADSTQLYDRLMKLFGVIDKGSRELNVPLYNGGLFLTEVNDSDQSPEAESARFLLQNKIPDLYLAQGLDRLSRSIDDKRQSLVPIDYKSVGVRQLGSIYEGLLEFKVRVAPEKMAIVEGSKKGTEEVIAYREASGTGRRVLTIGRGANATERIYSPGDVYLENDKKERKATGSYYTPDHIVKYIVENAVGPVLEERIDGLRPRFREAQQAYRAAEQRAEGFRRQGMEPDDPGKVVNSFSDLVDALFDLRVLDPSMGSGHFLVEAVDFICDRMLGQREGFLQAFRWNPVTAFLDETRRSILTEMERQGVSIDAGRLTDINLLKRHVLKRCVYGVDLNPMAVELAKVSLWLDCFTLGAPLSFLDHHLKWGNSLIGTTVQAVEAELAAQRKGHVSDLFGGPFQGLLAATQTILELARTPDVTMAEAERSRDLFSSFERDVRPFKRALDIWLSQHFRNDRAREYLTLAGHDVVEDINSGGSRLIPEYREVISKAEEISIRKRFFHWDLEFPEAFIDLDRKTWKTKENHGFDSVVGNPPYDELSQYYSNTTSEDKDYLSESDSYRAFKNGRVNLYRLFIVRGMQQARTGARLSYIVPMSLLADDFSLPTRRSLIEENALVLVDAFPQKDDQRRRVFPEAKLSTCVFVVLCGCEPSRLTVTTHPGRHFEEASPSYSAEASNLLRIFKDHVAVPIISASEWSILQKAFAHGGWARLSELADIYVGEIFDNSANKKYLSDDPIGPVVLRGANVDRYLLRDEPSQGSNRYLDEELYRKDRGHTKKTRLVSEERIGLQRGAAVDSWRRLVACTIPGGKYSFDTILLVRPHEIDNRVILGLLNSDLWEWRFRCTSTTNHVNEYELSSLVVPPSLTDPESPVYQEIAKLVDALGEADVRRSAHQSVPDHAVEFMIDRLVFQAYGLTEEEIRILRSVLPR